MKHENVHDLFSQAAEKYASRAAIECGARTVSYGELENKSNNLANFLLSIGASKGDLVAVMSEDPVEVITSIIGILKAGCAFVPLDPIIPEKRIRAMMEEAPARYVLVDGKFSTLFESGGLAGKIIRIDGEQYGSFHDTRRPVVNTEPDDMCYVYFTSGSTGRPKGIAGRLKGIAHFIQWEIKTFSVGEGTRITHLTTPAFDASLRDIFTPLCAGGTVCAPEDRGLIVDAGRLLNWIDVQRINLVHCVPSLFRAVLNEAPAPDRFACLTHILMAGEPLLPSDVKRWTEIFGDRIQLVNLYGPSETTMTKFFYIVKPTDQDLRSIPIGKPMEGARALVLDQKGNVCPDGTAGEIYIRTPFRSLGYYNRPELTQAAFIPNPFTGDASDLIYKTGDLGRVLKDGNFEFLGRKDLQVKVNGVRVELGEIEDLLRSHEAIKDVVVIDRENPGGDKYLCAYVVLKKQFEISALRDFLAASLPVYMLPSAFVALEQLPRTLSGKVERRALPSPASARAETDEFYVAHGTPLEESLAEIWRGLLGAARVGINDNFFELGGHSLLATQLLSRVRSSFDVELPLRTIFATPTIAKLALAITEAQAEQVGDAEIARMIKEIEGMSDEGLENVLNEEARSADL